MYMDHIENKYTGNNPIRKWLDNQKHKKFMKKISTMSHSIGTLWFFADFIKIAEVVYFYDNKNGSYIFSSRQYSYGENGFIIHDEKNKVIINCKLFSDDQKIGIEVKRTSGSNMSTEFTYSNNEWDFSKVKLDGYTNVLVDNTLAIISDAIVFLMEFCWNQQGNYDKHYKQFHG